MEVRMEIKEWLKERERGWNNDIVLRLGTKFILEIKGIKER